jgi:hypothetical protein
MRRLIAVQAKLAQLNHVVMPAKAGIHGSFITLSAIVEQMSEWIPAYAGMTLVV